MRTRTKSDGLAWRLFAVLLGVLVVSIGCAHSIVVAPKPPESKTTEKLPIDVGLYLSEGFKHYKVSEFRKGDKWNYDSLGEASATQFRLGLGQVFRLVELVDERPPFTKQPSKTFQAVIEPAIERFDFEIPLTKFEVYPARIQYNVTIYDMTGKVVLRRTVEGVGDFKGGPGFDFAENPSKAASKAVEDGANRALDALLGSEEVKALGRR